MKAKIVRKQLTPPGQDRVMMEIENTRKEVSIMTLYFAHKEANIRHDVKSISHDPDHTLIRATLMGLSPRNDSLVKFEAVEIVEVSN